MTENANLVEQREALRHQLVLSEHKMLMDLIMGGVGSFIRKLTGNPQPLPFWFSALVIALVILLIALSASILLGESLAAGSPMILIEISAVGFVLASMIAHKIAKDRTFATLREDVLDNIKSEECLADLARWAAAARTRTKPLLFGLILEIALGLYVPVFWALTRGGFIGFGPSSLFAIAAFVIGIIVYYWLLFVQLPLRLGGCQFMLYMEDPGSSEVISALSNMFKKDVYLVAAFGAIITLFFALTELLTLANVAILILLVWGPLTVLFLINQTALSRIITRAKWKTLTQPSTTK